MQKTKIIQIRQSRYFRGISDLSILQFSSVYSWSVFSQNTDNCEIDKRFGNKK